jgi:hypothetical protein
MTKNKGMTQEMAEAFAKDVIPGVVKTVHDMDQLSAEEKKAMKYDMLSGMAKVYEQGWRASDNHRSAQGLGK